MIITRYKEENETGYCEIFCLKTKQNNTNKHVFIITYFVSNVKEKPKQMVVVYGIKQELGTESSLQPL